jgi:hypothetical protein
MAPYSTAPEVEQEGDGTPPQARGGDKGQRRCILVVPQAAALGKPGSWRGYYGEEVLV